MHCFAQGLKSLQISLQKAAKPAPMAKYNIFLPFLPVFAVFLPSLLRSMRYFPILSLAAILLATACKTSRQGTAGNGTPDNTPVTSTDNTPYILALIIKASLQPDSSIRFEISKQQKANGKLKPAQEAKSTGTEYTLLFATANRRVVKTMQIKDPLQYLMEYSEESGKLETKMIYKQEDYFPVRINYTLDIQYILIHKNNPGSDTTTLAIQL